MKPLGKLFVMIFVIIVLAQLLRTGLCLEQSSCKKVCWHHSVPGSNETACLPDDYRVRNFLVNDHTPGDVEFLVFLPLHRRLDSLLTCLDFDGVRALERIEAVRVAMKHVNELRMLGGFAVGADILDSCNSGRAVNKRSVGPMLDSYIYPCVSHRNCETYRHHDPVQPYLDEERESLTADEEERTEVSSATPPPLSHTTLELPQLPTPLPEAVCVSPQNQPEERPAGVRPLIIGPSSSEIALQTTAFLGNFQFFHLSYGADSPLLSKRGQYRYFFRTVPVFTFQAKAVADLLERLAISHFAVFASSNEFGSKSLEEFLAILNKKQSTPLCAALSATFEQDDEEGISTLISNAKKVQLKTIVLFSSGDYAINFLKKAAEQKMNEYTWIGTNRWTSSPKLRSDPDIINVLGNRVLSISPAPPRDSYVWKNWANIKRHLEHRLHRLAPSPRHLSHNPWLKTAWENTFACALSKEASLEEITSRQLLPHNDSHACALHRQLPSRAKILKRGLTPCTPRRRLEASLLEPDEVRFLIHTIVVAVQVINQTLADVCRSTGDDRWTQAMCNKYTNDPSPSTPHRLLSKRVRGRIGCFLVFNQSRLKSNLMHANLKGEDPKQAAFGIAHLNLTAETSSIHRELGSWSPSEGIQWTDEQKRFEVRMFFRNGPSVCSKLECGVGRERFYRQDVITHRCCFLCRSCASGVMKPPNFAGQCMKCQTGYWPNALHSQCEKIVATFHTTWNLIWSVTVASVSAVVGMSALLGVWLNYTCKTKLENIYFNQVVLAGLAASSFLNALLAVSFSIGICILQVLVLWPCPIVVHAPCLLIKTNHMRKLSVTTERPVSQKLTLTSNGEILLWALLSGGALIKAIVWVAISTPENEIIYGLEGTAELRCSSSSGWTIAFYSITLTILIATTVLAFQTRKVQLYLSQSKYIFVASFFITLLWVFFLPATYILEKLHPSMLLAVTTTLQNVVIQVCVFARPIYFVYFDSDDSSTIDGIGDMKLKEQPAGHEQPGLFRRNGQQPFISAASEDFEDPGSRGLRYCSDGVLKDPIEAVTESKKVEESQDVLGGDEVRAPLRTSRTHCEAVSTENFELSVMFSARSPHSSNDYL